MANPSPPVAHVEGDHVVADEAGAMSATGVYGTPTRDAPDPRLLSTRFPHPHDGRVEFFDAGHWYRHTATGLRVPKSQTAATGPFFDAFNPSEEIDRWYRDWRNDRKSRYWALIHYKELVEGADEPTIKSAIQLLWRLNGERARDEGTKMHKLLEDYLNGLRPDLLATTAPLPAGVALYLGMMRTFFPEQQLEPWRVEFSVCVEVETFELVDGEERKVMKPAICGNVDAIFRSKRDGRYWILDWKCSDPKAGGLLGKAKFDGQPRSGKRRAFEPKMATGPF